MAKFFLIALVCLASCIAALDAAEKEFYDLDKAEELFEKYIKDYNKVYTDGADKQFHFEYFKKSLQEINDINGQDLTWWAGLNQFADMSPEERRNYMGLKLPEP